MVTHVTLLQQTFSCSSGIGLHTRHLHHSGKSSEGGSGSSGSSLPNMKFLAKSRLPLPKPKSLINTLSFFSASRVATNPWKCTIIILCKQNGDEGQKINTSIKFIQQMGQARGRRLGYWAMADIGLFLPSTSYPYPWHLVTYQEHNIEGE